MWARVLKWGLGGPAKIGPHVRVEKGVGTLGLELFTKDFTRAWGEGGGVEGRRAADLCEPRPHLT